MSDVPLILASQSPRRRKLLTEAGFVFDVLPPDDDTEDERRPDEKPVGYVRRMALQKAQNVAAKIEYGRIIACDTIVVCNERILEKPIDRADARRMLRFLRGQNQLVLSGLCILTKYKIGTENYVVEVETTALSMKYLSDQEIEDYLDSGGWQDKAGGFGYQDRNDWLIVVAGSESNIVGLPMELLKKMSTVHNW